MYEEQPIRTDTEVRVRLAADPGSVPGARHLVADSLRAWGRPGLVDDATLCASEMAGNAALHSGCSYIELTVLAEPDGIRILVEDDGATATALIAPRTTLPGLDTAFDDELDELDLLLADQPATGRGLAIVSVLARDWGVEELARGKRVWARLQEQPAAGGEATPSVAAPPEDTTALPVGWARVRLLRCPAPLARRHDQHLEGLCRELKLMLYDTENVENVVLARRLQPVVDTSTFVRHSVRRQVDAALGAGQEQVDVDLAMPSGFSRELRRLEDALDEADRLGRSGRLLSMPSSGEVLAFRAWLSAQVIGQAERAMTPTDWDTWVAQRR